MRRLLQRFPLLWVAAMFAVLIAAWATLITIAVNNAPEQIEIGSPEERSASDVPVVPVPR